VTARAATAVPGTRDRIVDAALRLFSERGTSGVSVREVADAAGVTVPGLYYHFAAKADLIREVYRANGVQSGWDPDNDFVLPKARAVADRIVEQARHEFARMQGNEEFLRHMQREDTLADVEAAADAIATYLWGLFVLYLSRSDGTVADRIEPFARLMGAALAKPA